MLVVKGAGGWRLTSFFSTAETMKGAPCREATTSAERSPLPIFAFFPSILSSFASKGGGFDSFQQGGEVPVLLGDERRISASRSQMIRTATDWTRPAERPRFTLSQRIGTDLIADETVEDPPGLLRLVPVEVEITGMGDRVEDRLAGEVVEEDAPDRFFLADLFGDVPGDGLPFAVRVRGEEDLLRPGRRLLEFGDHLLLAVHDQVGGFESLFRIDSEVVFRKVLDVTDGGPDIILRAEVFADGFHLGG